MARSIKESVYTLPARTVADIPSRHRPREQLERVGAENVADEVLLAVLLRSGVRGANVVDVARGLLQKYGPITALAQVSADDLAKFRGVGRVKAQVLKAALELAQRMTEEAMPERRFIRSPEDAARLLGERARTREGEAFWVLLLDTRRSLKREPVEITRGLLDASLVHPREVFKEAIRSNSAAVVLVHNHPSGDPTPSPEDIRITKQLVEAGRIVEIQVLDHVIIGRADEGGASGFYSLREGGVVAFPS